MSSPTCPNLQFCSNQVPSHHLLEYLGSEIRLREIEIGQIIAKKAAYEEDIEIYSAMVKREEQALVKAQRAVEFHTTSIQLLRSCPTVPFSRPENDPSLDTDQLPSGCTTVPLDIQLSASTLELETLLGKEKQRLTTAKITLQAIYARLEEPKAHLIVRESRIQQLGQFMETLKDNIRELECLKRPQLRIPDEVWTEMFIILGIDDFYSYRRQEKKIFFTPSVLRLSQVCQRWRRVTYNTPALWIGIGFHLSRYWEPRHIEIFHFMVERAGDRRMNLIANIFGDRTRQIMSPSGLVHIDIKSLAIRRTNFHLILLQPPPDFDLQQLSIQMGFSSFEKVSVFGNLDHRGTSAISIPDTPDVSLYDSFPLLNIETLGNAHDLELHTGFNGPNIDPSPYLFKTLRKLTLCGDCIDLPFDDENEVNLPVLVSLCLSPMNQGTLRRLNAPRLTTLILDPPDRYLGSIVDDWQSALLRVASMCSFIQFRTWKTPPSNSPLPPYYSATAVCLEIVKASQNLITVEFINSFIEGERLARELKTIVDSGLGTKSLKEMNFTLCKGITRTDCDALLEIIDCLTIYV
ncbi:hypothetical protein FRC18_007549 [Serendipita sp. 400]|nr:hypothetical protein FRC18_007549 [Serendipita sp. 400]